MTREEAIHFAICLKKNYTIDFNDMKVFCNMVIKALEQELQWIPVSERLPEDSGEYFVTVIDEDEETYKHVGIAWYAHPKDYDVEEGDWRELMIDEKVIAWMPLPKPFIRA